jgi:iron(III) transport system ATP-binding protein
VAFALRRRGHGRAECRARARLMLDRVGPGALAARYPNQLSGGEQQRVALARARVADTGLILCDEPLSNLDADLRERMRVEISALVRGAAATTIYITHDQAEAFAPADRVGVLRRGRLVQAGTPEEIYTSPATPFVARFTGPSGELLVRIRPAGPGLMEVEPPGADGHHLTGVVADVAFRGRGYEHAVDLAGSGRLTGVFAETRAARGEPVGLRLEPGACHVFPG